MSDVPEPTDPQPTVEQAVVTPEAGAVAADPAAAAQPAPAGPAFSASPADERPELVVGAAFAGGLVLALFLKRLAR